MFFDVWCSLTSGLFWSQNACDWVFCCSSMLNNVKNGFVFLKKKAFLVVKLKARDVFNECQMLRCFAWICMFHLKKKKRPKLPICERWQILLGQNSRARSSTSSVFPSFPVHASYKPQVIPCFFTATWPSHQSAVWRHATEALSA